MNSINIKWINIRSDSKDCKGRQREDGSGEVHFGSSNWSYSTQIRWNQDNVHSLNFCKEAVHQKCFEGGDRHHHPLTPLQALFHSSMAIHSVNQRHSVQSIMTIVHCTRSDRMVMAIDTVMTRHKSGRDRHCRYTTYCRGKWGTDYPSSIGHSRWVGDGVCIPHSVHRWAHSQHQNESKYTMWNKHKNCNFRLDTK